jgi:hypothetical protein
LYTHFELEELADNFFSFESDQSTIGLLLAEEQTSKNFLDVVKRSAATLSSSSSAGIPPPSNTSPNAKSKEKTEKSGSGGIGGLFSKLNPFGKKDKRQSTETAEPEFKISVKQGTFERKAHIGLNKDTNQMEILGLEHLPPEFKDMMSGFSGVKMDFSKPEEQEAFVEAVLEYEKQQDPNYVPPPAPPVTKKPPPPPTGMKRPPPPAPKPVAPPGPPPVPVSGGGAPPPPPPPPPPDFTPKEKTAIPKNVSSGAKERPATPPPSAGRDDLLSAIRNANPQAILKRVDPAKMNEQQKSNFESLLMQKMNNIRKNVEPDSDEEEEEEWDP